MTLQLTRLRVEQLRRFRQPFELAGLTPGLNILAGPNEAGKSTLVRAIRAAFFERHRSNAAEHLRPHGDSAAAPTIELDFLLDGQAGQLRKTFLARKRCELQWAGQRHEGAEAEDWLAQRFGFSYALKGESKPQNWGIPGLLWVEQGEGQRLDVDPARDYLHDALAGQAGAAGGALAASGGDELLERLRAQRQLLLTPKGGAPTGELAQLIKQGEALAAEREALDRQIQTYRQQVDELAALRQQHAADEAARPWEALQAQLDAARARQTELQALQAQLATDLARQTQLAQTRELLLAQLAQGTQLQAALAQRQQAWTRPPARRPTPRLRPRPPRPPGRPRRPPAPPPATR
jgi:DNA repair exonuclease SbcCD ATPase subunit